ncbi:MAG: septal ring lytic transglycosylase RlpA family protein [Gallionellaceae bacterium]
MNKRVVFLVLLASTLAACSSPLTKGKGAKAAPIVDLASGPSAPAPKEEPKAEASAVVATTEPEKTGGYLEGDGPDAEVPANLDDTPDAVPKAEPLHRYANREYTALGKTYTPLTENGKYKEIGIASWYGKKFHGQKTSIGEVYDMYAMTAAHITLPVPSYARVTNLANKKSVIVRVNDRGPFLHERIIDLSYVAAHKLGIISNGSAQVEVESIAVDGGALVPATVISTPITSAPIPVEPTPPVVVIADKPTGAMPATAKGNVYLQLGAFKSAEGAASFLAKMRSKLGDQGKALSQIQKEGFERINIGPYVTKDEARAASIKLKSQLGFKPFISAH